MPHWDYNYSKLLGRMRENSVTQARLAREIGVSETTLNAKLGNKISFKQDEIVSICKALNISLSEIERYFFSY